MAKQPTTSSLSARLPRPLVAVFLVTAFLLFFRISHVDMTGDDAHYSARAVAPIDFMFGEVNAQSTPVQWFDHTPWWSALSFHDHPKPLFLVQHLFLAMHQTGFFAKLPSALFALGSLVLMYFFVRRLDRRAAVLACLLLVLNAHFIWTGRVAYLESGVMFGVLLAVYYFIRYEENNRQWWKFGLAFGVALALKFTTLFLFPALLLFIALNHRSWFRSVKFYGALGIAFSLQLPLIIYNLSMYQATGHFSLQFVRLFHQSSPWHLSAVSAPTLARFGDLFLELGHLISWPYLALFVLALGYTLWWKRRLTFLLSLVLLFTVQQFFIGQYGYILSLYAIFAAPLIALASVDLAKRLGAVYGKKAEISLQVGKVILLVYLAFFVINSHVLAVHYGRIGWTYSEASSQNYGVAQLDAYLDALAARDKNLTPLDLYGEIKVKDDRTVPYLLKTNQQKLAESLAHSNIIIFDDRISWFSRVWLFERRRFYQNLPYISIAENNLLKQLTLNSFYFIKAEAGAPLDSITKKSRLAPEMEEKLDKLGIVPDLIYRDDGVLAFKVYYVAEAPQK